MGTFVGLFGELNIPPSALPELNVRMPKLLSAGGMFDFSIVKLFGKTIPLLAPLTPNEKGRVCFSYNYFEEDRWEDAIYDTTDGTLGSGKVGYSYFNYAMQAAYVLLEFYSETFCVTECNGGLVQAQNIIGWLNYLFGTGYKDRRLLDPMGLILTFPEELREKLFVPLLSDREVMTVLPTQEARDFICALSPNVVLSKEKPSEATTKQRGLDIVDLYDRVKASTHAVAGSYEGTKEELLEYLLSLFEEKGEEPEDVCEEGSIAYHIQLIQSLSPILCSSLLARIIAGELGLDFWSVVPRILKRDAPDVKVLEERAKGLSVIPPIPTRIALDIPDNDRAYWWDGSDDVRFSPEMEVWLEKLRENYREVLSREGELMPSQDYLPRLVTFAHRAFHERNLILFEEQFYEYLQNIHLRPYRAYLIMLEEELERGGESLKRLIAVLANVKLREKVLGDRPGCSDDAITDQTRLDQRKV